MKRTRLRRIYPIDPRETLSTLRIRSLESLINTRNMVFIDFEGAPRVVSEENVLEAYRKRRIEVGAVSSSGETLVRGKISPKDIAGALDPNAVFAHWGGSDAFIASIAFGSHTPLVFIDLQKLFVGARGDFSPSLESAVETRTGRSWKQTHNPAEDAEALRLLWKADSFGFSEILRVSAREPNPVCGKFPARKFREKVLDNAESILAKTSSRRFGASTSRIFDEALKSGVVDNAISLFVERVSLAALGFEPEANCARPWKEDDPFFTRGATEFTKRVKALSAANRGSAKDFR